MSHLAGTATHAHQFREHDWQAAEELAAAFDRLAEVDPEIRIDGSRADDGTVDLSLGAGRAHPESTRDFYSHAIDAARLFDRKEAGDVIDRWLSLVWKNAPEWIAEDPLGGTIKDAARASAIVVGRLWRVAAARTIAEQKVRDAADRVRDLMSLLAWAFTLSEAGWRRSDGPTGQDVEPLCPNGRAVHDWLIREIGTRTGLARADLEIVHAARCGGAADELGQFHRDNPNYLGWLVDGVRDGFSGAVEYLHLKTGTSETVAEPEKPDLAADLLDGMSRADADENFKTGQWFTLNTKISTSRLRHAASPKRKGKRVRKKTIDGVECYSVSDARRWWPFDMHRP